MLSTAAFWEGVDKMDPDFSWKCMMRRQKATDTSCNMEILIKYKDIFVNHEGGQRLEQFVQRRSEISILGDSELDTSLSNLS